MLLSLAVLTFERGGQFNDSAGIRIQVSFIGNDIPTMCNPIATLSVLFACVAQHPTACRLKCGENKKNHGENIMREEMSFEVKKANAIKLLEKYKFNEEVLQDYLDLKEDDEGKVVEFEVIDELNYPDGHGEKEILRFMKCNQLDDLSDKYKAEHFEVCLTWEESGM